MSKVFAIIGAGYGDEGKGLMTDYYSSQYPHDGMVIRSNGGAQAGHTVTISDDLRHVFSHFGSGSFNGTPTFLSKYFVSNPTLFRKEFEIITEGKKFTPKVYVDSESVFSTPYDMLLNQGLEEMRGDNPHGSCGVGFGETLERKLTSYHISNFRWLDEIYHLEPWQFDDYIRSHLNLIRSQYVPTRIDLRQVGSTFNNILNSEELIQDFIDDCRFMMENVRVVNPDFLKGNTLIFEGAQGLLLDMDYGYFPHVTRSNCGMKNIAEILKTIPGIHDVTANYITRAYTTRHGAGPLNYEQELPHNIVDNTNITNTFQGSLRFAPLDKGLFDSVTDKDFLNYAPRGSTKHTTITCVDQIGEDYYSFIQDNEEMNVSNDVFGQIVEQLFDYASYGPTKHTIERILDR